MVASSTSVPISEKAATGDRPPRRWSQWLFRLISIPLVCVGGYFLAILASSVRTPVQSRLDGPIVNGLHIDPHALELGEIWETPEHLARVTIKNVSAELRTLIRFEPSCDCLGVEPQGLTIPPGQAADVTLHLDLTHRQPYQLGLARWPVSVRLQPVFEGDFAPTLGWDVKAVVRSRVSLVGWQLAFGDRCTHTGPPVERKVRARTHQPLRRLEAVPVPAIATVRVEPVAGAEGEYFIVVSPRSDLPVGPFHFQVNVAAVTEDGVVHRTASLDVSGEMQPATRVVPGVILLGERPLGESAQGEVTVLLPSKDWTVDHIEAGSADTTVTRVGNGLDGGVQFRVDQRIAELGDQVCRIRFILRKPDGQTESVHVEVRYYGQKG